MATPLSQASYEQAGGSGLALGLSLQAKAPQFKDIFLERQKQKRLKEEKAEEEKKKALERWGEHINLKGIHRLDLDEGKGIYAEAIQDMADNYDNLTWTQKRERILDTEVKIQNLQRSGTDLETHEAIMRKNLDSPAIRRMYGAFQRGTWGDVEKAAANEENRYHEVKFDAASHTLELNPIEKIDTSAQERSLIGINDRIKTGTTNVYKPDAQGDLKKYEVSYLTLPLTREEAEEEKIKLAPTGYPQNIEAPSAVQKAKAQLQEEKYRRRKTKELYESGRLPKDYFSLPETDAENMLTMEVAKDIQKHAPVIFKETAIVAPGEGEKKEEVVTFSDLPAGISKLYTTYKDEKSGETKAQEFQYSSEGGFAIKPTTQNLAAVNFLIPGEPKFQQGTLEKVEIQNFKSHYVLKESLSPTSSVAVKLGRAVQNMKPNMSWDKGATIPDVAVKIMTPEEKKKYVGVDIFAYSLKKKIPGDVNSESETILVPFDEVRPVVKTGKTAKEMKQIDDAVAKYRGGAAAPAAGDLRKDGTKKGNGFLGVLKRPDGRVSTEISIGVEFDGKETEIPTLIPTINEKEKQYLLSTDEDEIFTKDEKLFQSIKKKAVEHARKRIKEGKSPFAEGEEEKKPAAAAPAAEKPKEEKSPKKQLSLKEYNRVKKKNISKEALQKAFGEQYEIID